MSLTLDTLFQKSSFSPNNSQRDAITHVDGPLFLVAGPGSGKTRVLLWRAINLIVFHGVKPEEIFLSTFTEKAAQQLKEGLLSLLGIATNETGIAYDISQMYVGTVHSLCQRIVGDRRFAKPGTKRRPPTVLDELDQYFHLYKNKFWTMVKDSLDIPDNNSNLFAEINQYLSGKKSLSKHNAVQNCISIFNRFSEEVLDPAHIEQKAADDTLKLLGRIYGLYLESLKNGSRRQVDFSLLQQEGYQTIKKNNASNSVFKHIIIDEYQDTNAIQEKIFFSLASGHKNICVVGDDDQALYRFRGATVENFVFFPDRCKNYLKLKPKQIALSTNYRSRKKIVDFYCQFIKMEDWCHQNKKHAFYRITDKNIEAHSKDIKPSVVASSPGKSEDVCEEIAEFVHKLIAKGKVADPNQIAFLYPSLKSVYVGRMKRALQDKGLKVYAPRAKSFLDNEEPTAVVGLLLKLFGRPQRDPRFDFGDNQKYHDWLDRCLITADDIIKNDPQIAQFLQDKITETMRANSDYGLLTEILASQNWNLTDQYQPPKHKKLLLGAADLSAQAKSDLSSKRLDYLVQIKAEQNEYLKLSQVINRATTLDWNVLDIFYRFCGFTHFKEMFDLAEIGIDEGPVCNMSIVSQYLSRFVDQYSGLVGGFNLQGDQYQRTLFTSYLSAIFRRGETEHESAEDAFPKGRIPFLTIHQAKGLEFPVVVLGNPNRGKKAPQKNEILVRPFLTGDLEPLDRLASFDSMRMFYVALSRAQSLLVIPHFKGPGVQFNSCIKAIIDSDSFPRITSFKFTTVPETALTKDDICRVYSFTSDYLSYQDCPRKYMIFRKYGFAPARSTTMFFGQLVHQTLDDLHHRLIELRRP